MEKFGNDLDVKWFQDANFFEINDPEKLSKYDYNCISYLTD